MGQRWAVLCSLTAICGCAHPYLKAGGTLAASLEKGDSAIGALMAMEVTTARTYPYARSMIGDPSAIPLETRFVRLVCLPYLSELPAERVALANLEKYRVFLALKAADPEDKDLASLLASLSKAGTRFVPADPDNAADELRKQDLEGFEECKARVQVTYSAPEPAHALVLPLLAAWPKVKEFLTYLAVEANRAEREGAIVESLKNDDTQNAIERSLAALSSSAQASGQLDVLLVKQKQMLLWSAHAYFISLGGSEMPGPISTSAYLDLTKKAGKMADLMKAYDDLDSIRPDEIVNKMDSAIKVLRAHAVAGTSPDPSAIASIISALDFLSDASGKYEAAASAVDDVGKGK